MKRMPTPRPLQAIVGWRAMDTLVPHKLNISMHLLLGLSYEVD
jgi:hypothetical protein